MTTRISDLMAFLEDFEDDWILDIISKGRLAVLDESGQVIDYTAIDPEPVKSNAKEGEPDPAEIEKGRRLAEEVHKWMEANEPIYRQMLAFVQDLKRRGVKGRVRDQIVIHFTKINQGKVMFKLTNGHWPGISRYMVLEDPTLEGDPLRFTRSAIDAYGLIPVSWMNVKP
ncbi:MAG: hypothetical protein HFJ65_08490 [Eggerthellaceae bacterium]|nr:hypothetical protein [Eggerthellaceae bacterium]